MRAFSLSILLLLGVACAPLLAQSAPLDEKQKAVMLFDIRMDLITGSELGKKLGLVDKMSAIPGAGSEDGPDPTKMTRVFGAMSAPENIQEAMSVQMGQMPFEFFVRMQFSDAAEVTKMIEKAKEDNGGTVEKNGKTYFMPPEGEGTPQGMMMHAFDDKTLEMGTEAYLFGGSATPFTDGLNAARKNLPKDQAIRLVMDLEGASGLISEAVGMGQQSADPMTSAYLDLVDNMKNLRIAIDLSSENLLMIRATGKDNDEAQELKEGLDAILELAKGGGNMGIKQAEDGQQIDAEESAVARAILGALEAKIDGTEVSITIPKPKNFDSVVEKAVNKFGGMMMGGGGPPPPR